MTKNKKTIIASTSALWFIILASTYVYANTNAVVEKTEKVNTIKLESISHNDVTSNNTKINTNTNTNEDNTNKDNNSLISSKEYQSWETIVFNNESINITNAWEYTISWKIDNGSITVDVGEDKNVVLNLNWVEITNSSGSPFYIKSGKATINLIHWSINVLTDSENYTNQIDNEPNATLFAKEDLIIDGSGTLIIKALYNDWLSTKDDLTINNGNIEISSKDDALRWKDSITINNGNIKIISEWDWLKSDDESKGNIVINNWKIEISAGSDGIEAYKSLTINGSDINILNSVEWLESEKIYINNGNVNIVSSDDGINASSSTSTTSNTFWHTVADSNILIEFNGGNVIINSTTDWLDSNGDILLNGGNVIVHWPSSNWDGALDYDGTMSIVKWEIVAIGSAWMALNATSSNNQPSILINTINSFNKDDLLVIKDKSWKTILIINAIKSGNSLMFSTDKIKLWETYTYSLWNNVGEFTIKENITNIGNSGFRWRWNRNFNRAEIKIPEDDMNISQSLDSNKAINNKQSASINSTSNNIDKSAILLSLLSSTANQQQEAIKSFREELKSTKSNNIYKDSIKMANISKILDEATIKEYQLLRSNIKNNTATEEEKVRYNEIKNNIKSKLSTSSEKVKYNNKSPKSEYKLLKQAVETNTATIEQVNKYNELKKNKEALKLKKEQAKEAYYQNAIKNWKMTEAQVNELKRKQLERKNDFNRMKELSAKIKSNTATELEKNEFNTLKEKYKKKNKKDTINSDWNEDSSEDH